MRNNSINDLNRANYGIDGPIVLRNLILIGIGAIFTGILAQFQLLPVQHDIANTLSKFCLGITLFNLGCITLSIWSSKIGKIREAKRMLDTYVWKGDEKVLDIGCGRGLMLISAAKHLTTGRAFGVDIWDSGDLSNNHPQHTLNNARIEGVQDKIEIKDGDARQLPFENNTFDVVLSSKVLHNIIERKKRNQAIHEIGRVLKPGGWVGIIDSFQYANIFKTMGWKNVHASGMRLKMFPPVKWTTGKKPITQ
ncbi:MAG: class I SAM-dependent methyltransferase [Deltaproteobacteria bacterium]|nr:class I SAM-dependent methyltransferase [Deltaproteobacteria bacterium]